jgi:hypothetical protein
VRTDRNAEAGEIDWRPTETIPEDLHGANHPRVGGIGRASLVRERKLLRIDRGESMMKLFRFEPAPLPLLRVEDARERLSRLVRVRASSVAVLSAVAFASVRP